MATTLRSGRNRSLLAGLVVASLCVGAGALTRSVSGQSTDWNGPPAGDFPLTGASYTNQRYSTLDQINTTNIDKLGGAWSIHLEEQGAAVGGLDGTPIVIGGVMYVTTPRLHVLAIDAATGAIKWRYRPDSETRRSRFAGFRWTTESACRRGKHTNRRSG